MLILSILAVLMLQSEPGSTADRNAATAELSGMDTAAAAALLLDPAVAPTVVNHHAAPITGMQPPAPPGVLPSLVTVAFFTAPQRLPHGVCGREAHRVEAARTPAAGFEPHQRSGPRPEIRLDADCAGATDRPFADLNNVAVEDASALMLRLQALQAAARNGQGPGIPVVCVSEVRDQPCPKDTTQLLAALPLDRAALFSGRGGPLELTMPDERLGDPYWSAAFIEGPAPHLRLTRAIPAPF